MRCEAMERTESVSLTVCEERAGGDYECEEDRQFGWQGKSHSSFTEKIIILGKFWIWMY